MFHRCPLIQTFKNKHMGGIRAYFSDTLEQSHTIMSGVIRDDINQANADAYRILNELENNI